MKKIALSIQLLFLYKKRHFTIPRGVRKICEVPIYRDRSVIFSSIRQFKMRSKENMSRLWQDYEKSKERYFLKIVDKFHENACHTHRPSHKIEEFSGSPRNEKPLNLSEAFPL